ncbi:MAG: hypothetical protein RJQ04_02135, partial [Longimicrobiales bacterium]
MSPSSVRMRRTVPSVVAALVLAACGSDGGEDAGSGALAAFPPPPAIASAQVSHDDFAGAEACADCHTDQYRAWASSTHGRAGG